MFFAPEAQPSPGWKEIPSDFLRLPDEGMQPAYMKVEPPESTLFNRIEQWQNQPRYREDIATQGEGESGRVRVTMGKEIPLVERQSEFAERMKLIPKRQDFAAPSPSIVEGKGPYATNATGKAGLASKDAEPLTVDKGSVPEPSTIGRGIEDAAVTNQKKNNPKLVFGRNKMPGSWGTFGWKRESQDL
jgi:hypothetical protein